MFEMCLKMLSTRGQNLVAQTSTTLRCSPVNRLKAILYGYGPYGSSQDWALQKWQHFDMKLVVILWVLPTYLPCDPCPSAVCDFGTFPGFDHPHARIATGG